MVSSLFTVNFDHTMSMVMVQAKAGGGGGGGGGGGLMESEEAESEDDDNALLQVSIEEAYRNCSVEVKE
jgi:hypothetical protein